MQTNKLCSRLQRFCALLRPVQRCASAGSRRLLGVRTSLVREVNNTDRRRARLISQRPGVAAIGHVVMYQCFAVTRVVP